MGKHYVEVDRSSGSVTIVNPDIPSWGTVRGAIEEYETLKEALKAVKEWNEYFDSIPD